MSFQDAVRTCLQQKYADFSGRARRSEFWYFVLFNAIVSFVASIIDSVIGTEYTYTVGSITYSSGGLVQSLAGLALLLPSSASRPGACTTPAGARCGGSCGSSRRSG